MEGARRVIRAVRILARDGRIPKPLRGLVAVGLLPIPGPFRDEMGEAWSRAGKE
jgi:hypothetical protein